MFRLEGKVALITGASGSIGGAIAQKFHAQGAFVIINGTNKEKLDQLGESLGNNYEIKIADLKNEPEKLLSDIEKLDILVCNAGITKDNLSIKMSRYDFDEVININLSASFVLNKAAVLKMMQAKYGRIINISSIVGFAGNPGQANYCASKAGLVGMTKVIASEVARRNITVNCIAPGFIISNMTEKMSEMQKTTIMQKIPMTKMGTPEDIAFAATFLASEEAGYITGHTIHVNGGMLML